MKQPLIVLAICTITTFAMGWFGHRVFSKSTAPAPVQSILKDEIKKIDSPLIQVKDTLVAKADSPSIPKLIEQENNLPKSNIILTSATNDTLWNDAMEIIVKSPDGSIDIKRKFKPSKTFKDFPVTEKFKGKPAKELNFSTCKYGKLYKTASKKALKSGPVFAGRFAFASINCGTGCYSSTIIDMKTGKVYDGPHASSGYQYKLNSRLLIVNPPPPGGFYTPCEVCEPVMYEWTGKEWKKL